MMFTVPAPEGTWLIRLGPSPDGTRLLSCAFDERGEQRLWVRSIATGKLYELEGTAEARAPFWSPDGEWVGFFTRSRLFKVPADGHSRPLVLAELSIWSGGAAWGRDGTIVFSPSWDTPLFAVSDRGGTPRPVTTLEKGEVRHGNPAFLADGRLLLAVVMEPDGGRKDDEGIYVQRQGEAGKELVMRVKPGNWGLIADRIATYAPDPPRLVLRTLEPRTLNLGDPEEHALPAAAQWMDSSQDLRILLPCFC
jgi:Tol biopolymer transport system component